MGVTWISIISYEKYSKTATHSPPLRPDQPSYRLSWITITPQLREFCQQFLRDHPEASQQDLGLRNRQSLGLDPDWTYDVFVELLVHPLDPFRPCPDAAITDESCGLDFARDGNDSDNVRLTSLTGSTPQAFVRNCREFFHALIFQIIRPGVQPFTGLGYTFDRGNPQSRVGASEFILIPGAPHQMKGTPGAARNYCTPNGRSLPVPSLLTRGALASERETLPTLP